MTRAFAHCSFEEIFFMNLHLHPKHFFIPLLSTLLMTACIKTNSLLNNLTNSNTDSTDAPPAITTVGTPIGSPSTATIGSSGGTLTSPDGKFNLTVPAGALSADLAISIQPITNEAPGGIGVGYDLQPSGTKFNAPVTLTYHYTDDDLDGTSPFFLIIATQDSIGEWLAIFKESNIDTIAKTVAVTTPHFSSYVFASSLHLEFGQKTFLENQSNYVKAMRTLTPKLKNYTGNGTPDEDNLPPLPPFQPKTQIPDNQVSHWSLNGQGTTTIYGNIIGSGAKVTFQAPSNIDKEQTVQVSAQLNGDYIFIANHKIIKINQVIVFGNIKLHPKKYSYDVKLDYEATQTSPCYGFPDQYSQVSTFHVDIDGDSVTVSNVVNQPPSTTPTSGGATDGSGETCSYNASTIGAMNLLKSGATGQVSPPADVAAPGVDRIATITLPQGNTIWPPSWTVTEPFGGGSSPWGGVSLPGIQLEVKITVNDQAQSYLASQTGTIAGTGLSIDLYVTITPTN